MNLFNGNKISVAALILVTCMSLTRLPLAARDRRGSTVEVTLADGSRFKGELLAVKADVLLLFDRLAGQGRSVDLHQVTRVTLFKGSRFLAGLGLGLVLGLGYCVYNLEILGNDEDLARLSYIVLPPISGLAGGILGALAGMSESFALAGGSSQAVRQNLKRLKRHARERDVEKPAVPALANGISSFPGALDPGARRQRQPRHRFRLLWSPGIQAISGNSGFSTETGTFRFASLSDNAAYPFQLQSYPIGAQPGIGRLRLEYEWTRHVSPSVELVWGKLSGSGYLNFRFYFADLEGRYEASDYILDRYSQTSLLFGLNWKPVPPSFARKHIVELGIAAGPALALRDPYYHDDQASHSTQRFKAVTWSCKAHAAYNYFYTESFSLGVFMEYQYLRASFPGAAFFNEMQKFWAKDRHPAASVIRPTEFTLPGRSVQLGGRTWGVRIGFRF